jgi:hypothetical protein
MILSLLALGSAVISFENPGIRLELFLKEISKQTGIGFHCPGYLNNEVLAASFNDQSVDALKSQLARVVHGVWELKEDGWWLVQTGEQKKEEQAWSQSAWNTALQTKFESLKEFLPTKEWSAGDVEKYWIEQRSSRSKNNEHVWTTQERLKLLQKGPEGRFMASLFHLLSPSMFSSDGYPGDTSFYSVGGLPNQLPLPIDIRGPLTQFRNEGVAYQAISNIARRYNDVAYFELIGDFDEVPEFYLSFYDKGWKFVASPTMPYIDASELFMAKGEEFTPSKRTMSFLSTDETATETTVTAEALDILLHATVKDPLGIASGKCWIDFAHGLRKPLLANLEEDTGLRRPNFFVPTIVQTGFTLGMHREDADGWVLGKPVDPVRNRRLRLDRKVIEQYVRLTTSPSADSLENSLKLQELASSITCFTLGIPSRDVAGLPLRRDDYVFAALGTLSHEQLQDCLGGKTMALSNIPERGQRYIATLVDSGEVNELSPKYRDDTELCPRFAFPNGITGMRIGATLDTDYDFEFEDEPVKDVGTFFRVRDFAEMMADEIAKGSPVLDIKFKVDTIHVLNGTLFLGDRSRTETMKFDSQETERTTKTYTWKTLPAPIKKRVMDAVYKIG